MCRASNAIGYSPLSCLLTDDGNVPYLQTLPSFDQCLNRITSLKNRQIETYYWGREHWAAELYPTEVRVVCQIDDTCFETVEIDAFEKILLAWQNFIQSAHPTELHEY